MKILHHRFTYPVRKDRDISLYARVAASMTMLDDFETMEVYDLCEKYGEYIDNRYYMYREEHGFEMPEDVFPGNGVRPYVEKVVRILKSKI